LSVILQNTLQSEDFRKLPFLTRFSLLKPHFGVSHMGAGHGTHCWHGTIVVD